MAIIKKLKTVISVILALLMAAGVTSIAFAAENEIVLSGHAGDSVAWTLTGDGLLTVSGTGPIKDETQVEYDENGTACIATIDSINMTVGRYFDTLADGLNAAERARIRFGLVKEIVVEEGITAIPQDEFAGMYPAKVTLPSTLESLGFNSFDLLFCAELTVNTVKQKNLEICVPAYDNDAVPYESLTEAKEDFIERATAQEAFGYELIPFDVLCSYAYVVMLPDEAGWLRMDEDEKQFILSVIQSCEDPEAAMENYKRGLALINSKKHYDEYLNSGFFTVVRQDDGTDTREAVCDRIAAHFGLTDPGLSN